MAESSKGFILALCPLPQNPFLVFQDGNTTLTHISFSEMITEFLASRRVAKNDLGSALECLTKANTREGN